MDFNEWAEYSRVGSTCDYDDRTMQFIEQYNNATFQTFMDNERKNRAVQGTIKSGTEGRKILPAHRKRSDGPISIHEGQDNKKVYSSVLRWARLVMDKLRRLFK